VGDAVPARNEERLDAQVVYGVAAGAHAALARLRSPKQSAFTMRLVLRSGSSAARGWVAAGGRMVGMDRLLVMFIFLRL
jgi:hypothetical protein